MHIKHGDMYDCVNFYKKPAFDHLIIEVCFKFDFCITHKFVFIIFIYVVLLACSEVNEIIWTLK